MAESGKRRHNEEVHRLTIQTFRLSLHNDAKIPSHFAFHLQAKYSLEDVKQQTVSGERIELSDLVMNRMIFFSIIETR